MKTPKAWFFFALIAFILKPVVPYLEGRTNSMWWIPPLIPVNVLPPFFLFFSCLVLLSFWIRSMLVKQQRVAAALLFLAALLLFSASFMLRRADFYQRGFRDYAKNVLTADEWRGIAHFAQEHLKTEGQLLEQQLPGPHKNLWNETDHRALWSALTAATKIQKLDASLVIFVNPGQTDIEWGGALAGHHGVTIFSKKADTHQYDSRAVTTFIAEDIAVGFSRD